METPTPSGHAFILRRFDTGAVSLTTMFRAAFPNAQEQEEKSELQWVKENYDLSGNNGGPQNPSITRLAGTWVSPHLAQSLGDTYALGGLITAVVEAAPDPNANYRRSGKTSAATPKPPTVADIHPSNGTPLPSKTFKTLTTPSPLSRPNPTKRRKESSPAPVPSPAQPFSPTSPIKGPVTRRRSRTRSPAATQPVKTPRSSKNTRQEECVTSAPNSDLTVVDEENAMIEDDVTGFELHQEDIAEQMALIENLKSQRAQKAKEEEKVEEPSIPDPFKSKRGREEVEEPLKFNFREADVIREREIASTNRVSRFQPRTGQLAWGAAAFAFGMSAVAFLPDFL